MFDVLISSQVRRRLHPGRGIVVAALHGVLVAGAVRVAQTAPQQEAVPRVDTTAFIIPPLPPAPERVHGLASESGFVPGPFVDLRLPPIEVPAFTTPVTVGPGPDPDRIRRTFIAGLSGPVARDPPLVERILGPAEVDDPAAVIHQPSPRYPPALRLAGIEGRVLVEFVIDTTGHIERGSLRVLEASHAGFEAAAREALERSVFTPARMGGRPVRQRTLQSIAFQIRLD